MGGWFVALPLTSGPVLLLLALGHGPVFAKDACIGSLLAITSLSVFALAYAWSARRLTWPFSVALSCLAFVASTAALAALSRLLLAPGSASLKWTFVIVCAVLSGAIRAMPAGKSVRVTRAAAVWDTPARMILAAGLVWGITSAATAFGSRISGLLTPFPITAVILAAFTHRADGGAAAGQLLHSLLVGLFSFAVFLLVVGATVERCTIAMAFAAGTIATLVIHAGVWHWVLPPRQAVVRTMEIVHE